MKYIYNDGGRNKYFKGTTGDCVVRAIAIATGLDYKKVYDEIFAITGKTPRNGVKRKAIHKYILAQGFKWVATMSIGSGCKVHLKAEELPQGILIAKVSKHLCTVIDGVINDAFDPSRAGSRCVYGYYIKGVA
jgi:hypothetical protein